MYLHSPYLSLEILRVGLVIEDLHEMKENISLLLNGVLLRHLVLKIGG